jgi:Tol biopolymer transport system component
MGEVYRARDTKLGREVALKILPEAFALDPDRLARFKHEAQVLASLNHTNIAAIHGFEDSPSTGSGQAGVHALVLELVEGPTLADRIAQGAMPLDEALPIARQIAEALEAAHEHGIIHRDLKPANVKLRPDGTVKVLDFGLAKTLERGAATSSMSMSPTLTSPAATGIGMILGTAAYMSPEQARGKIVDKRSDIWSFGCVLYEMLTGRRPFEGEDVTEVLARVLEREPNLTALPPEVPAAIGRLLRRCLEKDRKRRLPDIGVARLEIDEALTAPAGGATPAVPRPAAARRERLLWAAAVLVAASAAGVGVFLRPSPVDAPEMRLQIVTPPGSPPSNFAISPDGQHVVYGGPGRLWLRSLASEEARPLEGSTGGALPFWSPDSQSIAFFQAQQLKRIAIVGGTPQILTAAGSDWGGTWSAEGVILFAPAGTSPLFRIPATGGTPIEATRLTSPQQAGHRFPSFLPDGRRFLFFVTGTPAVQGVYLGSLDSTDATRVLESETAAVFTPPDYILFGRQDALFAQRVDPDSLERVGDPFLIAEDLMAHPNSAAGIALSSSLAGPVAYRASAETTRRQWTWFDRSGKQTGVVGEPGTALSNSVRLSPDGRTVATSRRINGNIDIWLSEIARGVADRFTSNPAADVRVVWSPDGARIAFDSARRGIGRYDLYVADVANPGSETVLLESPENKNIWDWSPDGRFILYSLINGATRDLWALPLDGDRKPFPVTQTVFEESAGRFSPDGRWIAYTSNESGSTQVYVRPFPGPGRAVRISTSGGGAPHWRADGREIFYFDGNQLMAAPVAAQPTGLDVSAPVMLFAAPAGRRAYDVSRDGRFLIDVSLDGAPNPPITILLNWKGARRR